jgi:hypothetical protein
VIPGVLVRNEGLGIVRFVSICFIDNMASSRYIISIGEHGVGITVVVSFGLTVAEKKIYVQIIQKYHYLHDAIVVRIAPIELGRIILVCLEEPVPVHTKNYFI